MSILPKEIEASMKSFCDIAIIKEAFIRKLPNGKWRVVSRKGKNLGTFDTEAKAKKHLQEVEFFKHKKASEEKLSYSAVMRFLNKNYDEETIKSFQNIFKENFDRLYMEEKDNPEEEALEIALNSMQKFKKQAAAIEMGDPNSAGIYLANIIRFLLRRIPTEKRAAAIESMKKKIYFLNEYTIASKETPPSASMGQSLTLIKTILLEHDAHYIRATLNAIVKAL